MICTQLTKGSWLTVRTTKIDKHMQAQTRTNMLDTLLISLTKCTELAAVVIRATKTRETRDDCEKSPSSSHTWDKGTKRGQFRARFDVKVQAQCQWCWVSSYYHKICKSLHAEERNPTTTILQIRFSAAYIIKRDTSDMRATRSP